MQSRVMSSEILPPKQSTMKESIGNNQVSSTSFQRNICRTCLCKIAPPHLVNIFSDEPFYEGQAVFQLFKEITHTLISQEELLPTNICLKCASKLKQAVAFKRNIDQAEATLRKNIRMVTCADSMTWPDSLCDNLTEIKDEYEDNLEEGRRGSSLTQSEKPKTIEKISSTQMKKPIDINKIRIWQANIDNIVAGTMSSLIKKRPIINITNKALNCVRKSTSNKRYKIVNQTSDDNDQTVGNKINDVTVFSGQEFVEKFLDGQLTNSDDLNLDNTQLKSPSTAKVYSRKVSKHPPQEQNDLNIINSIVIDPEMGDTVILIQDTDDYVNEIQPVQDEVEIQETSEIVVDPEVIEIDDDDDDDVEITKKLGFETTQNVENGSLVIANEENSDKAIHCNLEVDEYMFEKSLNLQEEITWIENKSTEAEIDPDLFAMKPEKPISCQKCNKRFTNNHILQRHMLYHSLEIEPSDDTGIKPPRFTNYRNRTAMEVYQQRKAFEAAQRLKAFRSSLKPQISKIVFPANYPMDLIPMIKDSSPASDSNHNIESPQIEPVPKLNVVPAQTTSNQPKVPVPAAVEKFKSISNFKQNYSSTQARRNLQEVKSRQMVPTPNQVKFIRYPRVCKYCNKGIPYGKMREHVLAMHREEQRKHVRFRFQCSVCKHGSSNKVAMLRHMQAKHELRFKCDYCEERFLKKTTQMQHMEQTHSFRSTSLCHICGKLVNTPSMYMHIRSHTSIRNIKCTVKDCRVMLKYESSLSDHLKRIHGTEKPYICERCGMRYAHTQGLRQHKRVHLEVMPLHCHLCGRGFVDNYRLKRHFLIQHQRLKPYSCPLCNQVFSYKESVKKHCFRFHPEHPIAQNAPPYLKKLKYPLGPARKKCFECILCNRKFGYIQNLKQHNRTFHPTLFFGQQ